MDIYEKIKELSLSEKAELVCGHNSWYTYAVPRLDIKRLYLTDGPLGVRAKRDKKGDGSMGLGSSVPSTAFPSPTNLACTWDRNICKKVGNAIGKEAAALSVDVLLAPGVNIKRDPRLGRNFEYWSEDPLLAGELAASYVTGVQEEGVSVSLKHFALNNSENHRYTGNSVCDERAKREIYFKSFETVIRKAHPDTVMCAYNKIDGDFCSNSKHLLTDILRNDWGFDGLVMTDWGATENRISGISAGCDLDMPGGIRENKAKIIKAVKKGELSEDLLDLCVSRVLKLEEKHKNKRSYVLSDLYDNHAALALEAAVRSAVLFENDGTLPLSKEGKYVVIGELFEHLRYQGNGSSRLNPARISSPVDAFKDMGINFKYAKGYLEKETEPNEEIENSALNLIDNESTVLFFAGLCDVSESEGFDRKDIRLAPNQLSLINKVKDKAAKTVVILFGGAPVETDFCEGTNAVLNMFLPGEMGGKATAGILFGDYSPSGHLTDSWPEKLSDVPAYKTFNKSKNVLYKESIFVGYRYYSTAKISPRYPFGYGLSYTDFTCSGNTEITGDKIAVSAVIKNAGKYDSYATLQVYSKKNENSKVFKPIMELRGFETVYIKSGEEACVNLNFDRTDLAYYNVNSGCVLENGTYPMLITTNGKDFTEIGQIIVSGEAEVPSPYSDDILNAYGNIGPDGVESTVFEQLIDCSVQEEKENHKFTIESTFEEMSGTLVGKAVRHATKAYVSVQKRKCRKLPEGPQKDELQSGTSFVENMIAKNSPRSIVQSSGGIAQMGLAKFSVKLANLSKKKKGR